jgi:hypothetical protein
VALVVLEEPYQQEAYLEEHHIVVEPAYLEEHHIVVAFAPASFLQKH